MNVSRLHQAMSGIAKSDSPPRSVGSGRDRSGAKRVLIVALDTIVPADVPEGNVLVVAPALNTWLRHWLSDDDAARRRAEERATAFVDWLNRIGVQARGQVGDVDPLLAIADALPMFPADEIVIAARPESSGLADELVSRARERFAIPTVRTEASLPKAA